MANFGPLSRGQPHSPNVNHCIFLHFRPEGHREPRTLNMNKSSGPNSIPYKILNLFKKDISKQLADLFNLSLSSVVFPSLL